MITVETAAPATLRYRAHSDHDGLDAAITAALGAQVEGSVITRVVLDTATAETLRAAGAIYQTEGGEWMDAGQRMTLVVS